LNLQTIAPAGVGVNACGMSWRALYVRSKSEFSVSARLGRLNYETYCPVYMVRRRWSDRVKLARLPLFPGYVFVSCLEPELAEVLGLAGVVQALPSNLAPALLSEESIDTIKRVVGSGLAVEPHTPAMGERVMITRGPLAGIAGVVVRVRKPRLIVEIENLQGRAIAVELTAEMLESAKATKR
jgi:transcriptional antiterminator NusG